jgi:hypothetical protein
MKEARRMPADGLEEIMRGIGPAMPGVAAVGTAQDGCWAIAFEDGREVAVEHDEAAGTLTLSLDLGRPDAARRAALRDAALSFNALWRLTGGLRIGQASPGGAFVLMLSLPAAGLTEEAMLSGLGWLRAKGAAWIAEMAAGAAPDATPAADAAMIRG